MSVRLRPALRHAPEELQVSIELLPGNVEWKMMSSVAEKYGMRLSLDVAGEYATLSGWLTVSEIKSLARRWQRTRLDDVADDLRESLANMEEEYGK